MTNKENATFITEISEEDFRKLDLSVYEQVWIGKEEGKHSGFTQLEWIEVKLNDILDENIEFWFNNGYECDLEDLQYPITVAIHVENGPEPKDYYFDKFMDRYSGFKTYEIAMGLKHIYSTRDYFESKEDYWRVPKRETKAIYRIHLDPERLKSFKLKHKSTIAWIFKDSQEGNVHFIEKCYDLDETTGEWVLSHASEVRKSKKSSSYKPLSEEEVQKLIDSEPKIELINE